MDSWDVWTQMSQDSLQSMVTRRVWPSTKRVDGRVWPSIVSWGCLVVLGLRWNWVIRGTLRRPWAPGEIKVHRVLPSGSRVPRIQGWLNFTEIRQEGYMAYSILSGCFCWAWASRVWSWSRNLIHKLTWFPVTAVHGWNLTAVEIKWSNLWFKFRLHTRDANLG